MSASSLVPVRFFCTAGNGMEAFLVEELKRKVAAQDIIQLQGKVLFSSPAHIKSLINLKSAERLFLLLNHDTSLKLPSHISQAKACSLLQSKLIGDKNELARVAMLWIRLQGELKGSLALKWSHGGPSEGKRKRLEHENPNDTIHFRICCKCSGSLTRYFNTQDVSKVLGASLSTLLGWKVDLKNPHLEVNVNLTNEYCLQGIPLTKVPLASRDYVQTTGLRATVAWAMASIAEIQPGSFVLDPMCGVGTILTEAAKEHNGAYFLGIDIDDEQLVKANGNVAYAHLEDRMQVLKASSLILPLHSASVDAVVCDLPFGRKFGTKMDAAINLPLILSEMTRVLRVGGILVLLLSPQLSCQIKMIFKQEDVKSNPVQENDPQTEQRDCQPDQDLNQDHNNGPTSTQETLSALRHERTFRVSLGAIDGLIHKYVKSSPCHA